MRYGMCNLSIIPVRMENSHRSEMVTQLLFGELFEIIEKTEEWFRIRISHDNYEGWIDAKQYMPLYNETYEKLISQTLNISLDIANVIKDEKRNMFIPILLGSSLPQMINNYFFIDNDKYFFEGNVRTFRDIISKEILIENAMLYLDAPYLWGGRSPFGVDCSGFVQMVFKLSGIYLPRDANQQADFGENISFISEASHGDIAFFDNDEGNIIHVGIILKNNQIIHASGRVRIDIIDHQGIYNTQLKKYTHKLRLIKKFL